MAAVLALSGCSSIQNSTDSLLGAVGLTRTAAVKASAHDQGAAAPVAETWTGTYRTVLPCADCSGLKVSLSLFKDGSYDLVTEAMGAGEPVSRRGAFTFNADETRITLDAKGQNRMFDILPPNSLRMLDKSGQPIKGPEAERFILKK